MAVLLVDAGNSRLKWAALDMGRLAVVRAQPWAALSAVPAQWSALPVPARVVVASVAGQEREALLRAWCQQLWARAPEFLRAGAEACGVRSAYLEPGRLGVDRWAALVAARHEGLAPACIVDCGSAVTVDVLDGDGRHRGGWIIPGLAAQRRALLGSTGALGLRGDSEAEPALPFGRSTEEAVALGCLNGVAALAREARSLADRLCGAPAAGILCGGDASLLLDMLGEDWRERPALVLYGAALLAGEAIEETEV